LATLKSPSSGSDTSAVPKQPGQPEPAAGRIEHDTAAVQVRGRMQSEGDPPTARRERTPCVVVQVHHLDPILCQEIAQTELRAEVRLHAVVVVENDPESGW
jgi:hypothetical protein